MLASVATGKEGVKPRPMSCRVGQSIKGVCANFYRVQFRLPVKISAIYLDEQSEGLPDTTRGTTIRIPHWEKPCSASLQTVGDDQQL